MYAEKEHTLMANVYQLKTIGTGTCLQLFAKWRRSAHLKFLQLIWQQQNFVSKQMRKSLNFFSCKLLDGVASVPVCNCV